MLMSARVLVKLTTPEKIKVSVFICLNNTGIIKVKKVKLRKKYTLNCKYLLDIRLLSNSLAKRSATRITKKEAVFVRETLREK